MDDKEKERALRYAFRRYDNLGPTGLKSARRQLKLKIVESTDIEGEVFDELFDDLINNNGWSEPEVMAYFELLGIEDRT